MPSTRGDSKEEMHFEWYLDELEAAGYITGYDKEIVTYDIFPGSYLQVEKRLKTKTKLETKPALDSFSYTPDYFIYWTEKGRYIFWDQGDVWKVNPALLGQAPRKLPTYFAPQRIEDFGEHVSIVEVKAEFDQQNMTREWRIKQKWLYAYEGLFCSLAKIGTGKTSLFGKTFTPNRYLLTDKTLKPRGLKYKPQTLQEYVQLREREVKAEGITGGQTSILEDLRSKRSNRDTSDNLALLGKGI